MFVDTHCHIFKEYYTDISKVISNALDLSVSTLFVAGCNNQTNEEVLSLTKFYSNVFGMLGIHPDDVENYEVCHLDFIESHLSNKKIIGIGEIGLDYHYTKENKVKQIELFERQLDLASKYSLPVVIHSREATDDTISILKKYPNVKGIIHSFSGSLETAKLYIKMGYKLGINGVVTFKNCNLKEILPYIYEFIVLETDSPYLTPHPYRGQQNEPKNVAVIASFVSEVCGISLEQLSSITNDNICEIFDISF